MKDESDSSFKVMFETKHKDLPTFSTEDEVKYLLEKAWITNQKSLLREYLENLVRSKKDIKRKIEEIDATRRIEEMRLKKIYDMNYFDKEKLDYETRLVKVAIVRLNNLKVKLKKNPELSTPEEAHKAEQDLLRVKRKEAMLVEENKKFSKFEPERLRLKQLKETDEVFVKQFKFELEKNRNVTKLIKSMIKSTYTTMKDASYLEEFDKNFFSFLYYHELKARMLTTGEVFFLDAEKEIFERETGHVKWEEVEMKRKSNTEIDPHDSAFLGKPDQKFLDLLDSLLEPTPDFELPTIVSDDTSDPMEMLRRRNKEIAEEEHKLAEESKKELIRKTREKSTKEDTKQTSQDVEKIKRTKEEEIKPSDNIDFSSMPELGDEVYPTEGRESKGPLVEVEESVKTDPTRRSESEVFEVEEVKESTRGEKREEEAERGSVLQEEFESDDEMLKAALKISLSSYDDQTIFEDIQKKAEAATESESQTDINEAEFILKRFEEETIKKMDKEEMDGKIVEIGEEILRLQTVAKESTKEKCLELLDVMIKLTEIRKRIMQSTHNDSSDSDIEEMDPEGAEMFQRMEKETISEDFDIGTLELFKKLEKEEEGDLSTKMIPLTFTEEESAFLKDISEDEAKKTSENKENELSDLEDDTEVANIFAESETAELVSNDPEKIKIRDEIRLQKEGEKESIDRSSPSVDSLEDIGICSSDEDLMTPYIVELDENEVVPDFNLEEATWGKEVEAGKYLDVGGIMIEKKFNKFGELSNLKEILMQAEVNIVQGKGKIIDDTEEEEMRQKLTDEHLSGEKLKSFLTLLDVDETEFLRVPKHKSMRYERLVKRKVKDYCQSDYYNLSFLSYLTFDPRLRCDNNSKLSLLITLLILLKKNQIVEAQKNLVLATISYLSQIYYVDDSDVIVKVQGSEYRISTQETQITVTKLKKKFLNFYEGKKLKVTDPDVVQYKVDEGNTYVILETDVENENEILNILLQQTEKTLKEDIEWFVKI
jgi:hypothetical protein